MANTKLYLDTRSTKSGQLAALKLIVRHANTTSMLPLNIKLMEKQWDDKGQKVRLHPQALTLNVYIHSVQQRLETFILELISSHRLRGMKAQDIRDEFVKSETQASNKTENDGNEESKEQMDAEYENDSLFCVRFRKYVSVRKASTAETYEHTLNRIVAWLGKDVADKLKFDDITVDWLNGFNAFLSKTSKSVNGRSIHFRNIRALYNDAIDNNIVPLSSYPFRKFKIKRKETVKRSLTVEELRQLFFFPCQSHQQKYVDMFKLSFMLMGVNMIDLANLKEIEKGRLNFYRSKTGHLYQMKVEPEIMALIRRYRGEEHLLFILDHWESDEFFRRKMNKEIQKIGPMTILPGRGGKRVYQPLFPKITSYWARHTWATIADELDIPDKTIAEALGHEHGNRVTNIYIRRSLKKVDEANRKVLDWVLYGKINGEEKVKPGTPEFFGLTSNVAIKLGLVVNE